MKRFVTRLVPPFLVMLCCFCTIGIGYSSTWEFDREYQPISKQEIAKVVHNPKATAVDHEILQGRAATSRLMEYAIKLYDEERKKRPSDPLIQSAFCYAVFISQAGTYVPSNATLFRSQQKALSETASLLADDMVNKAGAKIPFCWRVSAYQNIMGIGEGWDTGVRKAEKALSLAPNDPYTLRLLAFAHIRSHLGKKDKAIIYARRVVQLDPKSSAGYSYLYSAYADKRDYAKAFYYLNQAQARMPIQNRSEVAYTTYRNLAQSQPTKN